MVIKALAAAGNPAFESLGTDVGTGGGFRGRM
jgi:hypothetical protein